MPQAVGLDVGLRVSSTRMVGGGVGAGTGLGRNSKRTAANSVRRHSGEADVETRRLPKEGRRRGMR